MLDTSNWNILLVEDDPDAHEFLIPLLEKSYHSVWGVYNGEDALEIIKTEHPSAILIDLSLPNMDGWELLRKMHADASIADIPAVAVTAFDSPDVAQEAIVHGFRGYFAKPLSLRTFVDDLNRILE